MTDEKTKGLSSAEVEESRKKHGSNTITPPKRESVWKLFIGKFDDPVIKVLLMAAFLSLGISFIEKEFAETVGIFCAIFLATGVAFWFEYDAQKRFDMLGGVDNETLYKTLRDGSLREIAKKDIVVGDVVMLDSGEDIPADGVLSEAVSLRVNESNLTGEPVIAKSAAPPCENAETTYPSNMLLRGTTVMEGHGTITVTAVGDATEYGKVARQSSITPTGKTPLNKQLDGLAKFIGVAGFGIAALTFTILFIKEFSASKESYNFGQLWLLGVAMASVAVALVKLWVPVIYDGMSLAGKEKKLPRHVEEWGWGAWVAIGAGTFGVLCALSFLTLGVHPLEKASWITVADANNILQCFMVAVTLIVVSVPEGLPMSVTLSLALSMRRMLKSNNLVRKMHACETMGAATVICTDKTGTLTQNRMSVSETLFFSLDNGTLGSSPAGKLIADGMAINSTAFLERDDSGGVKAIGNPTEGALLLWLDAAGIDFSPIRSRADIVDQMTFSTERKFMATLIEGDSGNILYIKGAPEIVLSKCLSVAEKWGLAEVDGYRDRILDKLLEYQQMAMRTLGFAYCEVGKEVVSCEEAIGSGTLIFLGVTAIMDPVREDVPDAIARCLGAGIDVKIVTGDTPGTAREIARRIGLWGDGDGEANHITGVEFEKSSDAELLERVAELKIMSRARPTDKQRLVQLLQQRGEVVAVTGDGTNDAPALNFAQVGLSMGSGTSVAKEASDITLLDDSFNSIATAVMWGRSLYRNIQRFIVFQLTINFTALIVVFLGSLFGAELPLTVTQMLWVNLIMDTFAAGALASLPPDPKIINEKPRKSDAFIITRNMSANIMTIGTAFVIALVSMLFLFGEAPGDYNLSVFFTVFVMLQFWNMFNARCWGSSKSAFEGLGKSGAFLVVLLLILAGQILIVTYGGSVFRTVPISLADWIKIVAATSSVLWFGEIVRIIRRIRYRNA